jgi:hypothetical protein
MCVFKSYLLKPWIMVVEGLCVFFVVIRDLMYSYIIGIVIYGLGSDYFLPSLITCY